jgi:hypothetical protein
MMIRECLSGSGTWIAALAGALALAACAEPLPTDPTSRLDLRPTARDASLTSGEPDDPNVLGRAVPGFGGFFLDEQGTPTVYLREPRRRPQLERALSPYLLNEGLQAASLRVLPASFELGELESWFGKAGPAALSVAGAVYADVDEASNRLRIGVENAALGSVRNRVSQLGIPANAVIIEAAAPIHTAATLQDGVRPVVGGLEIDYTGGWRCTLGFSARAGGVSSFITASHCSIRYGSSDGTRYTQPGATSALGTEVFDPPFFTGGACPVGRRCRYSDATRAAYAPGVPFTLGTIAKTTGVNDGSLGIAGSLSITRESGATAGSTVNKIGRSSGWTRGRLIRTCVMTNVAETNVTLLCQHWVAAGVLGGDSGSPVFLGSGGGGVALAGVLWGGDAPGTTFIFSPIASVERELGALITS